MVAASLTPACNERVQKLGTVPVIDFSWRREHVAKLILRASEEFGFFRVINHGVPRRIVSKMEAQAAEFFALPVAEKQRSGPPNPLGYGRRNIGFNGDTGELEYLILQTNPATVTQRARTVRRKDPVKFSCAVNEYVGAVRELTCDILDMLGESLGLDDTKAFSKLIRDGDSDSLMRLNRYPSCFNGGGDGAVREKDERGGGRVGFGEHSDPQLISVLRSNDVEGLQILTPSTDGGVWVPVPPDSTAFCVSIGDLLQAMTNGRLVSVRHRAMANSYRSRSTMIYFGGPPLHTLISPLPETITPHAPRRYKSFTWAEYKKAMYSLRLGYNRLDLFSIDNQDEGIDMVTQF